MRKAATNASFAGVSLPTNQGLPTISPSAALPAISPSLGELLPLPPMNSVSAPKPSWRAASSTPDTGSTSAEMPIASGFSSLILVSWAEKSLSLLPKLSMPMIVSPAFSAAAFITSKPDLENASSLAYSSAIVLTPRLIALVSVTGMTSLSGRLVRNT